MATFLYNPDRKSKTELIAEFVVRTDIYDEIMHDLETSRMEHPEQHYLLVGQRGSGKTTLLNRIKYGIEDSEVLSNKVIPIIFSEEQYNISELVNLWESIAQYLEDYHGFENLYDEVEVNRAKANFEELSYEILERHLNANQKKLVLLIDNIGDMLKKMEKTEVHRWREILQTESEIRLIAGSPFYLETVLDYQQPLFEFFKVLRLDGLNAKETQDLLLKLGEVNGGKEKIEKIIKETPERIETLRTLTGGVPRTIALMFNIFIEYNNEDTVKDLEKILDAVTPLYKHRMDDLPTQQQKIVDAVAKNWDGISVKELKEKVRIESKTISAQLRQLEKNQIIERIETRTKNNIYFLKERFFNIWYLMRYGRKYDKQRVIWLVKFLESWCTMTEIEQRILDYIAKVKNGKLSDQLISFYGEVYVAMDNLKSELKIMLKENAPKYLAKNIKISNEEILNLADVNIKNGERKNALQLVLQIYEPTELDSLLMLAYLGRILADDKDLMIHAVKNILEKMTNKKNDVSLKFGDLVVLLIFHVYSLITHLITGDFTKAKEVFKVFSEVSNEVPDVYEKAVVIIVNQTLIILLSANQPNSVISFFENSQKWKDRLKPVYYATLKILKREEVLKMGTELQESVDKLLLEIEKSEDLYKVLPNRKR